MSVFTGSGSGGRFDRSKGGGRGAAIERLKDWTRARFALADGDTVMVTEEKPNYPGCPPMETVVSFWVGGRAPHHFRVFKAAHDVVEGDIPPGWMRDSLSGLPGVSCSCC